MTATNALTMLHHSVPVPCCRVLEVGFRRRCRSAFDSGRVKITCFLPRLATPRRPQGILKASTGSTCAFRLQLRRPVTLTCVVQRNPSTSLLRHRQRWPPSTTQTRYYSSIDWTYLQPSCMHRHRSSCSRSFSSRCISAFPLTSHRCMYHKRTGVVLPSRSSSVVGSLVRREA